jgi:hypothetical protein
MSGRRNQPPPHLAPWLEAMRSAAAAGHSLSYFPEKICAGCGKAMAEHGQQSFWPNPDVRVFFIYELCAPCLAILKGGSRRSVAEVYFKIERRLLSVWRAASR